VFAALGTGGTTDVELPNAVCDLDLPEDLDAMDRHATG
jgi:hypothetical protein